MSTLSARVTDAFIKRGLEPPTADRVDRVGFTFAERKILDSILTHPEAQVEAQLSQWTPEDTQVRRS